MMNWIKPELLSFTGEQCRVLMPVLVLCLGSILGILLSVVRTLNPKWSVFACSLFTFALSAKYSAGLISEPGISLFNGMLASDSFSNFLNIIYCLSGAMTLLASFRYLDRQNLQYPEYYLLVMFAVTGMSLLSASLDLIVLFIALEVMSLAVYVLVGFRRSDRKNNEAAMKYFILGSIASALLLFGVALLYGSTGHTDLVQILTFVRNNPTMITPVFALGALFLIVGFLFKVASVPFHMWMPDVYEGAPTPITGFMTTGLKAAAFGTFLRVIIGLGVGNGLPASIGAYFHHILVMSIVLTMIVANIVALYQTNLKRLLAYSSIAHTGYLLMGLLSGGQSDGGYGPVISYLLSYSVMNLGAFAVLSLIGQTMDRGLNLQDLAGLSKRHPWLSFSLAVFLFSMAGVPPTAGFIAKYFLFSSAVQAGEISLVVVAVLCSAMSAYYYLRILVYMYMKESDGVVTSSKERISALSTVVVAAMVTLTLQVGLFPDRMVEVSKRVVAGILQN